MINKFAYLVLFILFTGIIFAQTSTTIAENHIQEKTSKKFKTLTLSILYLSESQLSELKDELSAWREKVNSIEIIEKTNELVLVHNKSMDETDLFDVLKKYNVKKDQIISYK
jgi:hypothetical protein